MITRLPMTHSPTGISLENNNSGIFTLYEVLAFYKYKCKPFVVKLVFVTFRVGNDKYL